MELNLDNSGALEVTAPQNYRFCARDYPVVYRQFLDFYNGKPPIKTIHYWARDIVLLQIIVIQHFLEPEIAGIRGDNLTIYQSGFHVDNFHFLRTWEREEASDKSIVISDYMGATLTVEKDIFTGHGNAFEVEQLMVKPGGDIVSSEYTLLDRPNFCLFDYYQEKYQEWHSEYPNATAQLGVVLLDAYSVVQLCAAIAVGDLKIAVQLPMNALRLLENTRLNTLNFRFLKYENRTDVSRCFSHGCDIENLILTVNGRSESGEMLSSFVRDVPTRKRVCLKLGEHDADIAPNLFRRLFHIDNTTLSAIAVKMEDIHTFEESQIEAATTFMNRLCDTYLMRDTSTCTLVWHCKNSFPGESRLHQLVCNMRDRRFEDMVDYMWDKYTLIYHRIPLDDHGNYELPDNAGVLRPDIDEPVTNDTFSVLEDEENVYPIIQRKERFRAIVKRQFGEDVSLGRIFTYLQMFAKVMVLRDDKPDSVIDDVYQFFHDDVGPTSVSDAFFTKNLTMFYHVKDKHHILRRIFRTGVPALLELFASGYGDALLTQVAPFLVHT